MKQDHEVQKELPTNKKKQERKEKLMKKRGQSQQR